MFINNYSNKSTVRGSETNRLHCFFFSPSNYIHPSTKNVGILLHYNHTFCAFEISPLSVVSVSVSLFLMNFLTYAHKNLAVPTATSPPRPIPSTSSTITVPRPINADKCPSTRPFDGQSCSDDPQSDYYRCGYWDQDPNPTKIIDCRCNHVHEFVCNDADSMMYQLTSSSSF